MKVIAFCCIGFGFLSMSLSADDVEVEWRDDFKLEAKDFGILPTLKDNQLASVYTGMHLSSYNKAWRAVAVIDKRKSYMLRKVAMGYRLKEVLNHEKGHFDIAEYVSRRLNKRLQGIKDEKVAIKIFDNYFDTLGVVQEVYDAQTSHSTDSIWQGKWDQKLRELLSDKSVPETWMMYP